MSSAPPPTTESVDGTIQFLNVLAQLKRTKRQGWVESKVQNVESVADHSHRMSVLALLCPDPALKRDHMVKMAVCHDIAEAIAGDITPAMKVSKEDKYRMEHEAMEQIGKMIPGSNGEELRALWEEYEAQETPEAQFVRDLDLLEMVAQAHFYEAEQSDMSLPTFYVSGQKIQHPWARAIFDRLAATRPQRTAAVEKKE